MINLHTSHYDLACIIHMLLYALECVAFAAAIGCCLFTGAVMFALYRESTITITVDRPPDVIQIGPQLMAFVTLRFDVGELGNWTSSYPIEFDVSCDNCTAARNRRASLRPRSPVRFKVCAARRTTRILKD